MKQELRRIMKRQLSELAEGVYLPVGIESLVITQETRTLFAFLSHGGEIDTTPLIRQALARGIQVALPRVAGSELVFHAITLPPDRAPEYTPHGSRVPTGMPASNGLEQPSDGELATGAYGIREPKPHLPVVFAPERTGIPETAGIELPLVVLVPGLAFSRDGSRLGRGKGYYDRFIRELLDRYPADRSRITLAGTCHAFQIVADVPTETHDIGVDCLLTGAGCILCT